MVPKREVCPFTEVSSANLLSLKVLFCPIRDGWKIGTEFMFLSSMITNLLTCSSRYPLSHALDMTDTNFAIR